ncbi:Protein NRT1/ PTR family 5.8 [Vitis vinifera]|uniref:Protein NRT1/ PTR family 5.8 n=1 Tax=Vitis vinifera TaxID=29760 RepID=A0A438EFV4_VITVI|nr:Protein NRT1/ PTR family 5.8 [Vitis vinifera]
MLGTELRKTVSIQLGFSLLEHTPDTSFSTLPLSNSDVSHSPHALHTSLNKVLFSSSYLLAWSIDSTSHGGRTEIKGTQQAMYSSYSKGTPFEMLLDLEHPYKYFPSMVLKEEEILWWLVWRGLPSKGWYQIWFTYLTDVVKMSNSTAAKTVNSWCGLTSMLALLVAPLADSYWYRRFLGVINHVDCNLSYWKGAGSDHVNKEWERSSAPSISSCSLPPFALVGTWIPEDRTSGSSFLFWSLYLISLGLGGYNPSLQAFGADQLETEEDLPCTKDEKNPDSKSFVLPMVVLRYLQWQPLGVTVMSYIQDTSGWGIGFAIPTIVMIASIAFFSCGTRLQEKPLCRDTKDLAENHKIIFQQPATFFTKQGMTMKRNIGRNLLIPPAMLQSAITVSIIVLMPLYDKVLIPFTRLITRKEKGINVMQRMGIGMVLSIIAMVIAALVEKKRLSISSKLESQSETVPLSIFWLLPQYIILGIADIFTVVGMQEFFYGEVPIRMRTMGIALYSSVFGVGSFMSAF